MTWRAVYCTFPCRKSWLTAVTAVSAGTALCYRYTTNETDGGQHNFRAGQRQASAAAGERSHRCARTCLDAGCRAVSSRASIHSAEYAAAELYAGGVVGACPAVWRRPRGVDSDE